MENYRADTYGEGFAAVYDGWYADISDTAGTVAKIGALASVGLAVELGIGSGRLAKPLTSAGVNVLGIDASAAMIDKLAHAVPAARADMALLPLRSDSATVVFVAFNTFFNLTTEGAQHACLAEVARILRPGGWFVIEAFVPPAPGETSPSDVSVKSVEVDRVILTVAKRDDAAQTIAGQHIEIRETGNILRPWLLRFLTPSQIDQYCARVGLALHSRCEDWVGSPFDEFSSAHVSIYKATFS